MWRLGGISSTLLAGDVEDIEVHEHVAICETLSHCYLPYISFNVAGFAINISTNSYFNEEFTVAW